MFYLKHDKKKKKTPRSTQSRNQYGIMLKGQFTQIILKKSTTQDKASPRPTSVSVVQLVSASPQVAKNKLLQFLRTTCHYTCAAFME